MLSVPGIAATETSLQPTTATISHAPQQQVYQSSVHQSHLFATLLFILLLEEQCNLMFNLSQHLLFYNVSQTRRGN